MVSHICNKQIYKICDELENPEYMLVISSYEKGERNPDPHHRERPDHAPVCV